MCPCRREVLCLCQCLCVWLHGSGVCWSVFQHVPLHLAVCVWCCGDRKLRVRVSALGTSLRVCGVLACDSVSLRRYLSLRADACSLPCPAALLSYLRKDLKRTKHGHKNTGLSKWKRDPGSERDQKKSVPSQEEMAENLQG